MASHGEKYCCLLLWNRESVRLERPKVFYLGSKQYDPVHLGLDTAPFHGGTEFRVDLPGNSNAGHEFNDGPISNGVIGRKLSEDERMQIIEYLKTL